MKTITLIALAAVCFLQPAAAHSWKAEGVDRELLRQHIAEEWVQQHSPAALQELKPTQISSTASALSIAAAAVANVKNSPAQSAAFQAFPKLQLKWDADSLFVGSNGMPDHKMMVGITNWQQQVPLPQNYFGDNAWRIPLHPVPAKSPALIEGRFLRGAIALAVNGIPIFNPQNNRGEVSYEIGELDQWGGHCGRADDYHYHIAPLHLQAVVGKGLPIAYALDGYPIYGEAEPDGSPVGQLDECHGHENDKLGYHYHASTKRPYLQSAFHGEVVEAGGQVDPQPRAQSVREALTPLRGAEITGFASLDASSYKLSYAVNGDKRSITYSINADGTYPFEFDNGRDGRTKEVYTARRGGGPEGKGQAKGKGKGKGMKPDSTPPQREAMKGGDSSRARGKEQAFVASPDQPRSSDGKFLLTSPEVEDFKEMPKDYSGDGSGATLPLNWKGAPIGTKGYALIMDHTDPEGAKKWYWTVYDIPASVTSLPKNVQGVGKVGTGFRGQIGYEPPHSKGQGAKTYVLTVYALSAPLNVRQAPREVNREVLLAAIKGKVLASSSLRVIHTSGGNTAGAAVTSERVRGEGGDRESPLDTTIFDRLPPRAPVVQAVSSAAPAQEGPHGDAPRPDRDAKGGAKGKGKGKGGPDNKGLIKPAIADTIKVNVYADNWFMLYINGRLTAVDSIDFIPHNVVSVDILPEYPMTIAVMAKDNADAKTGMEYGDHIGDGGFIIKFADGTVSNATWKAKSFFKGPLNHDSANPKVEYTPIPANWYAVDFDDSKWAAATEYTEERVNPKEPFYNADFSGAKFIWTEDLDLDNTIIFRTKVDKPGWTKRWNTKPDLDVSGAPVK